MISECCGAEDTTEKFSYINTGLCPECLNECNFISEEEFGNEYARSQEIDALTGDE